MSGSGRPVSRPPRPVQRWFQEGLDHVKALMPDVEPYRAWALFSFVAPSGRVHEFDLFVATPGGLYLVELKARPGRVVNNGATWTFNGPDRPRTIRNPLPLTDWKSKELRSRLSWGAREPGFFSVRVPRAEPAVFLTAEPGLGPGRRPAHPRVRPRRPTNRSRPHLARPVGPRRTSSAGSPPIPKAARGWGLLLPGGKPLSLYHQLHDCAALLADARLSERCGESHGVRRVRLDELGSRQDCVACLLCIRRRITPSSEAAQWTPGPNVTKARALYGERTR
ncbi:MULTISPECIES: NERD domain-containing protein [Actinomadura]|uniref:NERD domain-containing protein n=1 Tax=Actinomadura yumaensis TaxID=111807 RepID=A0ABW2CL33_9ACTN